MKTKEEYIAQIDVCMGGRAAETLIFGPQKVTQGASNDFQRATQIATEMVTQFGFSDKLGKVTYDKNHVSSQTKAQIEQEVKELLDSCFTRVLKLLGDHEKDLHKLAETLLEHETLSAEQIKKAINYRN